MANAYQIDNEPVPEGGTYSPYFAFKDKNGDAATPNSGTVKWSLTKKDGKTEINGRTDIMVAASSSITILLQGDDLVGGDRDIVKKVRDVEIVLSERRLYVYGEINTTDGDDQPVTLMLIFFVVNK